MMSMCVKQVTIYSIYAKRKCADINETHWNLQTAEGRQCNLPNKCIGPRRKGPKRTQAASGAAPGESV